MMTSSPTFSLVVDDLLVFAVYPLVLKEILVWSRDVTHPCLLSSANSSIVPSTGFEGSQTLLLMYMCICTRIGCRCVDR